MEKFSEEAYAAMTDALFKRFPSFQKDGVPAYKPGIGNMLFFDRMLGHPHGKYRTIHVAGTNGKGSVSNMLAAILASSGFRVGLYTSPHIFDFRERMRVADGRAEHGAGDRMIPLEYVSKKEVWDFVQKWRDTFEHLDLSFFEITTAMAFDWFAAKEVDVAVIETGLGGRLDSTNIISPVMSVITNIGLDHCDMLGGTLPEIAFEKAGIIKPKVPAVVGESNPETDPVFERKVLYTNISEPEFQGDRTRVMPLLTFADKIEPSLWDRADEILAAMDLRGAYQRKNLRTVLAASDVLGGMDGFGALASSADEMKIYAIGCTASIMDFHGRWEKLCDIPYIIADIGHNSHGLKYNFSQLRQMMSEGGFGSLTILYGAMSDKDVREVMRIMPDRAEHLFVTAPGKRAMAADMIRDIYLAEGGNPSSVKCCGSVKEGLDCITESFRHADCGGDARRLVYIGGSTYVVSEAASLLREMQKH